MEPNMIRLTNEYLVRSDVNHLPITFEKLTALLKTEGFDTLSYQEADEIIERFKLREHTKYPAFLFVSDVLHARLVLYDGTLSIGERMLHVAHELGHIVCNHCGCGVRQSNFRNVGQERDANAFMLQFLAPRCVLKANNIRTVNQISAVTMLNKEHAKLIRENLLIPFREPFSRTLIQKIKIETDLEPEKTSWRRFGRLAAVCSKLLLSVLLTAAFSLLIQMAIASVQTNFSDPIEVQETFNDNSCGSPYLILPSEKRETEPDEEISVQTYDRINSEEDLEKQTESELSSSSDALVYVTPSGKKYHRPGCRYIKEKENLERLTKEEAVQRYLSPCTVCCGDT